ncbi:reverse transcriptase [Tanacetum coccineum]
MRHHKLYAKMSECVFGTDKVEYLGHVIFAMGVATDPSKVEDVSQWLVPANLKQLRQFLGLTKEFTLETDASSASGVGLGTVLLQEGHPIAFLSKTLSSKHKLMSTYEKEFLAIVYALEKRRGFDYEIQYKKGVENVTTDALSRLQSSSELFSLISTNITTDIYQRIVDSWKRCETSKGYCRVAEWTDCQRFLYLGQSRVKEERQISSGIVFYWKKMRKHVKQLVLEFYTCQRYKPGLAAYPGLLQPLPMPNRIWSSIFMDFTDSLPKSQDVAQVFLDNIYKLHGLPNTIVSDWDKSPPIHVPYVGGDSRVESVDITLAAREEAIEVCKFHLKMANDRMKSQADKHRTDREVGQVACQLQLPDSSQIHNVFYISQLKKCRGEVTRSGVLPVCNEQGVLRVEPVAILDRRLAKRGNVAAVFVLVQWENGSKEDATWEPIEQIQKNFPSFKI